MSAVQPRPASPGEDNPIVCRLTETLFEVTVSKQNRLNFFSDSVQRLNQNREEAEVTLRNLKTWSPELADSFRIRDPDTLINNPFRLICESDLGHVPFDSENVFRQFIAVSYCWRHDDNDWPGDGSVPSAPWPFSRPFVDAILSERGVHGGAPEGDANFRREGIWIDQMCIRQSDEVEKQQSIAMMDIIYDRCRKLLILLEDVTFTPEEVRVLEKYNNPWPKTIDEAIWKPEKADVPHLASLCAKVENSRWWSRSWCWHEIEVNKPWSDLRHQYHNHNATFVVKLASSVGNGSAYKLRYMTLQNARHASMSSANYIHGPDFLRKTIRWTIGDNKTSPYQDPPHRGAGTERSSLLARFFVTSYTDCSIASDIVSISINLCGLALYFVGHFRNHDRVFFVMATLALACGEKRPLTWMDNDYTNDYTLLTLDERGGHGNSWLSRPTGGLDTGLPKFTVGGVRGLHRVSSHHIELDLLFFEAPVEKITDDQVKATYEIFPDNPIKSRKVEFQNQGFNPHMDDSEKDDKFCDSFRRKVLAGACNIGLAGIRRFWAVLEREVVEPSFNNARFVPFAGDDALRPAAKKMVDRLSTSDTCSIPALQDRNSDEEIMLSFLTFLTDPRALYMITPCPGIVRCNEGEGAILGYPALRFLSDYHDQSGYRLAIPTDLVDSPSNVPRVWILQPLEEGEKAKRLDAHGDNNGVSSCNDIGVSDSTGARWRLVGKCLLLGEPSLVLSETDGNMKSRFLALRKRQWVQG
ncbi:uncharacterized protein JN550_011811 [Neoarthrinium moseri]|uniref:uncharacterized protein n=1 Tax=Neoarthrinium moseri TaxID=1658444 RepID=UPI001FDC3F11|nr:uncharacterized protein JN550_011811 [Neoarthrinium moseri]KAI1859892.1 hypothetical protein JN550_011811 [Neoarthrinium moseri]